jgi:hypothetical protein
MNQPFKIISNPSFQFGDNASLNSPHIVWRTPPSSSNSYGEEGWMAYDSNFYYIYAGGIWKRQPLTNFVNF